MGCNCMATWTMTAGLIFYLGTGAPAYQAIVPNRLYHHMGGKRFEDITYTTNTGHIQKGHAVALCRY